MEFSVEIPIAQMLDHAKYDELAEAGITSVSAPFAFVESSSRQTLRECAAALAARGIRVDTAHPNYGSYNSANSLVNQYKAPRQLYLEQLKDGLDRMSLLGARVAPLHTGGCCLPGAPRWSLELCAESVKALIPAAIDAGITLALENTFFSLPSHWDGAGSGERPAEASRHTYDDVGKLCELIDMCASSQVRGCFDAGHAHCFGDLVGDHQTMGSRIALYHLHDNSRDGDAHMSPGYGTLNWEALGPLFFANEQAHPAFIETTPWMRASHALMVRQTRALLKGGRRGESRRCLICGHLILADEQGIFCGCEV